MLDLAKEQGKLLVIDAVEYTFLIFEICAFFALCLSQESKISPQKIRSGELEGNRHLFILRNSISLLMYCTVAAISLKCLMYKKLGLWLMII